jgi:hypothetical protein
MVLLEHFPGENEDNLSQNSWRLGLESYPGTPDHQVETLISEGLRF